MEWHKIKSFDDVPSLAYFFFKESKEEQQNILDYYYYKLDTEDLTEEQRKSLMRFIKEIKQLRKELK